MIICIALFSGSLQFAFVISILLLSSPSEFLFEIFCFLVLNFHLALFYIFYFSVKIYFLSIHTSTFSFILLNIVATFKSLSALSQVWWWTSKRSLPLRIYHIFLIPYMLRNFELCPGYYIYFVETAFYYIPLKDVNIF